MDLGLVATISASKQMEAMNQISVKMMDKAIETVEQNGENMQKLLDSASASLGTPDGIVSATQLDVRI